MEAQAGCLLDDDAEQNREEDDSKPVRLLTNFAIFDPRHKCELVSLGEIEKSNMLDREFEGAGDVKPFSENDEDEGQDEDLMDGEDAGQRIRLSAILRYWTDYTQDDA